MAQKYPYFQMEASLIIVEEKEDRELKEKSYALVTDRQHRVICKTEQAHLTVCTINKQ